ncbi:MAG TPA: SDR family oxidoreductase [Pirellulales bacterium]|jgi:NAD(P)-dependent dehydrogenase (short-subunit alcohol dehydrogenase family)|nr:SDR family oxidoreductase [Pirellulales bacterium]
MADSAKTSALPSLFDLTDRVAILTGGAGLLGKQYTRAMLAAGARVVVADLDGGAAIASARAAADEIGGESLGVAVDITKRADVERMAAVALERWGSVDILVNNAAIDPKFDAAVAQQQASTFEDYPLPLWQQSLDVNLTGAMHCCQVVGRSMVGQKRGVIVNVSSTYGLVAPDQRLYQRDGEAEQTLFKPAAYAVTKAGIAHFTRYLAAYWAAAGIRVNTLTPHGIYNSQDEQFVRRYNERCPMRRMARADEMNGPLLFLVSDASSYMTGSNLIVDGGWTAW